MDNVELIGFLASAMTTVAYIPQVIRTWRTGSARDFSLPMLLLIMVGCGFWTAYGFGRGAPSVWFGNALTCLMSAYILSVKVGRW